MAKGQSYFRLYEALENNEDIKIRNPEVTLPWQNVLESLSGYLPLVSKMYQEPGIFSGACNFGTNCNSIVSVRKIVSMIVEKWGDGKWLDISDKNKPHEANLLSLDINKTKISLIGIPDGIYKNVLKKLWSGIIMKVFMKYV